MSKRTGPTDSTPSIRSKIAREAAHAAVEEFVNGPHFQRVVKEGVAATLYELGIDIKNPEEVKAFRADMTSLRDWRLMLMLARRQGFITTVTVGVTFLLTAASIGIGMMVLRHG